MIDRVNLFTVKTGIAGYELVRCELIDQLVRSGPIGQS